MAVSFGCGEPNDTPQDDGEPGESGSKEDNPTPDELLGCKVFVDPSVAQAFATANDPFTQKILVAADCRRTDGVVRFQDVAHMLSERGCEFMGRAFVTEQGQMMADVDLPPRGIDAWQCDGPPASQTSDPARKVYLANFGEGPQETEFEIISFDAEHGVANFYTHSPGPDGAADFVFNGNSFAMAPANLDGFPGSHPCSNCHTNGGLLIKETRFPWMNWHSPIVPLVDVRKMATTMQHDGLPTSMEQIGVGSRGILIGELVETLTLATAIAVNEAKIDRIQAGFDIEFAHENGARRPHTIRDLMKPMLCENEVALATSLDTRVDPPRPTSLPRDLFLNRLLMPLRNSEGASVISVGGLQVAEAEEDPSSRLDANGFGDDQDFEFAEVTVGDQRLELVEEQAFPLKQVDYQAYTEFLAAAGVSVAAGAGGRPIHRFGRVPFLVPARSFSDDDFVSRLINRGVVEERLVRAALMVDFPNPVFSTERCELLADIPTTPVFGTTPEQITEQVRQALAASSKPAAAELVANLDATAEALAQRISDYRTACEASPLAQTFEDLYPLLRAKTVRLLEHAEEFAIEGFVLPIFPEVDPSELETFLQTHQGERELGLAEACTVDRGS